MCGAAEAQGAAWVFGLNNNKLDVERPQVEPQANIGLAAEARWAGWFFGTKIKK